MIDVSGYWGRYGEELELAGAMNGLVVASPARPLLLGEPGDGSRRAVPQRRPGLISTFVYLRAAKFTCTR
jgi:hypothetical protein